MGNNDSKVEEKITTELDIEKAKELLNFDRGKINLAGVKDSSGHELALCRLDGKLYPPFGQDFLRNVRRTKLLANDVILCGYPTTGTDWLVQMITSILYGHGAYGSWTDQLGFLESVPPSAPELLPSPRLLYTHMPFRFLPTQIRGLKTKLVLSRRNPKDTLINCFHQTIQKKDLYNYEGDFNSFFQLFLRGQVSYGSYFDYYRDWDKVMKDNQGVSIHVMDFENMKEDLPRTIRSLAKFLEVDISDSQVDQVVYDAKVDDDAVKDKQVGAWKNYMTVAQSELMDSQIESFLKGIDYHPRYVL